MDPTTAEDSEVACDFPPFFKVYRDGRVERYMTTDHVEPGFDPETGVQSKDVVISTETGVKARIFLPQNNDPHQKLPLLVHYHGGAFCLQSPFSSVYKKFLSTLASQANVMIISTDYRLAPEHLLPIAYNDSFAALEWVAHHSNGQGPDPWINQFVDRNRIIVGGESAGATIAHYVAVQAGAKELDGVKINRLLIVHPYFGGKEPDKFYQYMCPTSPGRDDPKMYPDADPDLLKLKCERILVCVAEADIIRARGVSYFETMRKSGWEGSVEYYETKGEGHCFFFFQPMAMSENIKPFFEKIVDFINKR